jgi:hypothetical protein
MFCLKKEKYHMTNFFIYLEKVLAGINFFGNNYIIDKIPNFNQKNSSKRNEEFIKIKDKMLDEGSVYVYDFKNNPHFNFKIGSIIYELVFMTNYNQSKLKVNDKLQALENKVDPKTAGRYGIAFYPRGIPGVKYGNVQLKPEDSTKLFDYLRTCAESGIIDKRKFYFDGAYTKKETKIINKLKELADKMKKEISKVGLKNKDSLYKIFLNTLKDLDITLKQPILDEIKKIIIDKNDFEDILEKIAFIMRDELNINFNIREKYFVKLLEKQGIKATIGDKYTRTIFFNL